MRHARARVKPAISGSARSTRAKARATLSARSPLSITKSVRRTCARAIPISRRCGLPGGAGSSAANGTTRRPAARSRSRFRAAIDAYALAPRLARGDAGRAPAGDRAAGRFQPRGISRLRRRERGRAAEAGFADRGRRRRTGRGGRARAGRDGAGADPPPPSLAVQGRIGADALSRRCRRPPRRDRGRLRRPPSRARHRRGLRRTAGAWRATSSQKPSVGWTARRPAILPAFVPLGPLRLDLDRLERNAARPFDPIARSLAAPPSMGDLALGAEALTMPSPHFSRPGWPDLVLASKAR